MLSKVLVQFLSPVFSGVKWVRLVEEASRWHTTTSSALPSASLLHPSNSMPPFRAPSELPRAAPLAESQTSWAELSATPRTATKLVPSVGRKGLMRAKMDRQHSRAMQETQAGLRGAMEVQRHAATSETPNSKVLWPRSSNLNRRGHLYCFYLNAISSLLVFIFSLEKNPLCFQNKTYREQMLQGKAFFFPPLKKKIYLNKNAQCINFSSRQLSWADIFPSRTKNKTTPQPLSPNFL